MTMRLCGSSLPESCRPTNRLETDAAFGVAAQPTGRSAQETTAGRSPKMVSKDPGSLVGDQDHG